MYDLLRFLLYFECSLWSAGPNHSGTRSRGKSVCYVGVSEASARIIERQCRAHFLFVSTVSSYYPSATMYAHTPATTERRPDCKNHGLEFA